MTAYELGKWGEYKAADYLENKSFDIMERNFRCKYGEIDIIAKENNTLCFVEVKTRTDTLFGLPNEAVTFTKQKKLTKTALTYLSGQQSADCDLRMDVVEIVTAKGQSKYYLRHLKDAFPFYEL